MKTKHKLFILGACIFAGTVFSTDLYGMEMKDRDEQQETTQTALCQQCNEPNTLTMMTDIRAEISSYRNGNCSCECVPGQFLLCTNCYSGLEATIKTSRGCPNLPCSRCGKWCRSKTSASPSCFDGEEESNESKT